MLDSDGTMILGRKHAPQNLGRVLVLGLGKSGKAVSQYCQSLVGTRVESLTIFAGNLNDEARRYASGLDASRVSVKFNSYSFDEKYDLCIVSPGIPQVSDFYQNALAASGELIAEVEFAWRESAQNSRWVAISGTNGKTTTTALTAHILEKAGMRATAVGNIGDTCIEAVVKQHTDIYVVEVSSYQLASMRYFAPDVAVLLNITPDHLSWHGSYDEYVRAKLSLFNNLAQNESSHAILDATNDEVRTFIKKIKMLPKSDRPYSYIPLGAAAGLNVDMRRICGSENAAFVDQTMLCIGLGEQEHQLVAISELQIKGEHNVANALAASSAALALGIESRAIAQALPSFEALEHRIEPCGTVGGVSFYNDSKATNIDATLKALTSFGKTQPIVLLGGSDKGTELQDLVRAAELHSKAVVCYGAAGPRFFEAFSASEIPSYLAEGLAAAFTQAVDCAEVGDVVILSPACASFDEFTSFEHRGKAFKDLVNQSSEQGV